MGERLGFQSRVVQYLEQEDNEIKNNSNSIRYGYDLNLNLYKENTEKDK